MPETPRRSTNFWLRGTLKETLHVERLDDIRVAYNSFSFTDLDGRVTERGIPH